MDIDSRPFINLTDKQIQSERFRLQKLASECSASIGALKTELLWRAIEAGTKGGNE